MELLRLAFDEGAYALRRDELPKPTSLEREQVLVEVEAAALAGPEIARAQGLKPDPGVAAVGCAVEAGPGAEHLAGSRVVVGPVLPCGDCDRCRRGMTAPCQYRDFVGASGGEALASHVLARARWLCPLDPPIEVAGPEACLLGREASLAYALYARAGLAPGSRALVLGSGAVARISLDVLASQGIRSIAVATEDAWAEVASAAGAGVLRARTEADAPALREELRATAAEEAPGDGPDAILETSGEPALRALAVTLASPGSLAILASRRVTGARGNAPAAFDAAADGGATLRGVCAPHPDLLPEVAALAARGELDLRAAAATAPVAEISALADRLARGHLPGRAGVVSWPAPRERA